VTHHSAVVAGQAPGRLRVERIAPQETGPLRRSDVTLAIGLDRRKEFVGEHRCTYFRRSTPPVIEVPTVPLVHASSCQV
jgi:hypothetical protein